MGTSNVYDNPSNVMKNRWRDFDETVELCPVLCAKQRDRAELVVPARRGPRPDYERARGEDFVIVVEEIDNTVDEFWRKLRLNASSLRAHDMGVMVKGWVISICLRFWE
jgi:hypothetical protein